MPSVFPSQEALVNAFASRYGLVKNQKPEEVQPVPVHKQRRLFPAWSAVDDVKHKAEAVGHVAAEEFDKASQAAQAKAGKIELHSAKYYAACTFGGLLACVSID